MTISELCEQAHRMAKEKGFWDKDRNNSELLMLAVTELGEACEGLRHGNPPSDKIPEFSQVEEEIGDCMIRIADMAQARGYNLEGAIKRKLLYNQERPQMHGKKF